MSEQQIILIPFGQSGLIIESEQDPDATGRKVLVNAPAGSLKHAVNVDFQGKRNLHRRLGYHDAFHDPGDSYDDHLIFNGGAGLVSDHTWGDSSDDTYGIRGLDRYTYMDNRQTKQDFDYEEERYTLFAMRYISEDALLLIFDDIVAAATAGDVLTQLNTGATMVVWASGTGVNGVIIGFDLETGTWDTVAANTVTGGSLVLNPNPDNPNAVVGHLYTPYDPDVHGDAVSARTAAYHWRNPGNPNIRILETPLLDRLVWDSIVANAFSDANRAGENPSRFWDFETWGLLGEQETFLIGTCGGHFEAPEVAIAPRAWSSTGAGIDPPVGSFDSPYINAGAVQRRCYTWWPDWYRRWAVANAYTAPPDADNDAGTYNWYAPFIFYYEPYNVAHDFELTLDTLTALPTAPVVITQAVSGASMQYAYGSTVNNTLVGQDLGTGVWDTTNTVSDGGGGTLAPDPATVISFREKQYDEFYAEPCGAFIEEYHECLFMAKIERTVLIDAGYQTVGTLRYVFGPNEIMYSYPGYATAQQFGTSTVPPSYPFAIPFEPGERPWGCASPDGYKLNRIAYAEPRGKGVIVGMTKWNEILYIVKPQGFTAVYGSHPINFEFRNLGMSQGPSGRFAWVKTDEGIYYVTKNGLFLFRGNPGDALKPLSDDKVEKVFTEDIDYPGATDFSTGELIGVSLGWDRNNNQIIISYPKRGEQGGESQPLAGTPTRQLVYDTTLGRFTEWEYKLPIDSGRSTVGLGIMKGGEDPTDDDYMMGTHPIGNYHGSNDNGRLLFRINHGYLDQDSLDGSGELNEDGNLIPYNATSNDMTFGNFNPKQNIAKIRTLIYANNGNIQQHLIFNMHDTEELNDLVYTATDEDNFLQSTVPTDGCLRDKHDSNEQDWSLCSITYYHDEEDQWDDENIDNIGDGPIQFVSTQFELKFNTGATG